MIAISREPTPPPLRRPRWRQTPPTRARARPHRWVRAGGPWATHAPAESLPPSSRECRGPAPARCAGTRRRAHERCSQTGARPVCRKGGDRARRKRRRRALGAPASMARRRRDRSGPAHACRPTPPQRRQPRRPARIRGSGSQAARPAQSTNWRSPRRWVIFRYRPSTGCRRSRPDAEAAPAIGMPLGPTPAPAHHLAVQGIKQGV